MSVHNIATHRIAELDGHRAAMTEWLNADEGHWADGEVVRAARNLANAMADLIDAAQHSEQSSRLLVDFVALDSKFAVHLLDRIADTYRINQRQVTA